MTNITRKEFLVSDKKMRIKYTDLTRSVDLETFTNDDYFATSYTFSTANEARIFFDSFDETKAKTMKLLIDFSLQK